MMALVLKSTGSSGSSKKNSPGETAVKYGDFIAFVSTNWSQKKVHDLGPKSTGDVIYQGQLGMKGSFNMTHDIDDKLEIWTQYHP